MIYNKLAKFIIWNNEKLEKITNNTFIFLSYTLKIELNRK
jgi:hypothetical protein